MQIVSANNVTLCTISRTHSEIEGWISWKSAYGWSWQAGYLNNIFFF